MNTSNKTIIKTYKADKDNLDRLKDKILENYKPNKKLLN